MRWHWKWKKSSWRWHHNNFVCTPLRSYTVVIAYYAQYKLYIVQLAFTKLSPLFYTSS